MKIPKSIGACADRLFDLRAQKSALTKQVDDLDEERKAIENYLIANLPKSEASGVSGKRARVSIILKEVPSVKDWPAFYAHVLKTRDFSLMQKRVSNEAIRERWEAKKSVPGVEAFTAVTVSVTKP